MARSREKAQLMFNKWATLMEEVDKGVGPKDRRPFLASECKTLPEAEKWRRDVLREISRKVAEIQNAGIGEARIRDLNDEINKLLRIKGHWETQILALGGQNYAKTAPKMFDAEGLELPGSGGYKYFGAAKLLPGVRELFEEKARAKPRRTRGQIMQTITPDYFGYRDDDDGVLVEAEAIAEARLRAAAEAAYIASHGAQRADAGGVTAVMEDEEMVADNVMGTAGTDALSSADVRSHVALPTQADIEAQLLAKKKALLLAKYGAG